MAGKLSTFKFEFKGKDGGIFTATDLIPVPVQVAGIDKYRFQVVGQEKSTKGTKKDQYITIDTTMIGSTTSIQVAAFKLDTIVAAGGAQYQGGNEGLQTFKLSMDLGNDSISMTTDSIVRFVNGNTKLLFMVVLHLPISLVTRLSMVRRYYVSTLLLLKLRLSHLLKVLRLNWLVEQVFTLCN